MMHGVRGNYFLISWQSDSVIEVVCDRGGTVVDYIAIFCVWLRVI